MNTLEIVGEIVNLDQVTHVTKSDADGKYRIVFNFVGKGSTSFVWTKEKSRDKSFSKICTAMNSRVF